MTAQMIGARSEITRPAVEALTSTVLDHATVVDMDGGFGYRNNEGLWQTYNCLDLLVPTPTCARPLIEADFKDFKVAGFVPGFEFGVHGGVQCSVIGLDQADQQSEVERVFAASEGKGVEMALLLNRFVDNPSGSDDPGIPYAATWEAPVDLSVDGMTLSAALAALTSYAAAVYAGQPTIHMPRGAALVAFGAGYLTERDGKFFTKTGAKVAAGGGYDDPDNVAWDGTMDLYATGEVYVERSKRLSFQEITMPGDGSGTGSDQNGLGDNTSIALVERMFRVGIDCFAAKATGRVFTVATP
jgi:hypothetical protein